MDKSSDCGGIAEHHGDDGVSPIKQIALERVRSNYRKRRSTEAGRVIDQAKVRDRQRKWLAADPRRLMMQSARERARKAGVPFAITLDDIVIPDVCPVLGVKLQRNVGSRGGRNPTSPSLDRLIGALGYVPGNIAVISNRANHLKNDATLEELESLVRFLKVHLV